ncbi:alpha/beta hydrolase [Micromonospora cathayae]|uniref:Alpha/beta hydrolase n=1 Tax=Micromonospora cathayae TaxID=3028804 RepID=A0ABY8A1R2_9ACTN|nr:alpha/beta hydrolase [Micromonospora sp. HUAS 3]WDZ87924.1 alpha/beta hydrolase [Micromonospora sp. HUAS 3]
MALSTAVLHPQRVRTVTGLTTMPWRKIDVARYVRFGMFAKMASNVRSVGTDEQAVDTLVEIVRMLSAPGQPFDEEWARQVARISHARSPRDVGTTQRHFAAGRASEELTGRIGEIRVPTLLINGADDPVVRPKAAAALAARIPGARAEIHPQMGHAVQEHLWPRLVEAVATHAGSGTPVR